MTMRERLPLYGCYIPVFVYSWLHLRLAQVCVRVETSLYGKLIYKDAF